ncbi:MAG: hypothetical protein U0637_10790 [Phycisphaerales bacterium]
MKELATIVLCVGISLGASLYLWGTHRGEAWPQECARYVGIATSFSFLILLCVPDGRKRSGRCGSMSTTARATSRRFSRQEYHP